MKGIQTDFDNVENRDQGVMVNNQSNRVLTLGLWTNGGYERIRAGHSKHSRNVKSSTVGLQKAD